MTNRNGAGAETADFQIKCSGGVVEPNKSSTYFCIQPQERGDDLCINRRVQLRGRLKTLTESSNKARHPVDLRLGSRAKLLRHLAA